MRSRPPQVSNGAAFLTGCTIFGVLLIVFAVIAVLAIGWALSVAF